jgi:nucleoredoxin
MSAFSILGDELQKSVTEKIHHTVLEDVAVVALYFSAKWCGPCQAFTPKLISLYNQVNASGKQLEIVYVSGDSDEDQFEEYYGKMPWLAVEFGDNLDVVNEAYPSEYVPKLTILKKDGSVLIDDASEDVSNRGVACFQDWLK